MKIVKFKIQNLILGCGKQLDDNRAMMYRCGGNSKFRYDNLKSAYYLKPDRFAEFFTYFNSFSYSKWIKYTNVKDVYLQLRCKGSFRITMFGHFRDGNNIGKEMMETYTFRLKEMTDVKIPVPSDTKGEVLGFQFDVLQPDDEMHEYYRSIGQETDANLYIEEGGWYTDISDEYINDVNISIATTTFKKEEFIERNIDVLERELFYSGEPAAKHFHLKIVDNGRTLNPEMYESEHISIYPNDNVGGAGGFTRGMIESLDYEPFKATHVLLMDDDVMVLPEAFIRTYSLLALLKPEYDERYVSGAMLYFERMNIQHEDVGYVHEDGSYGPNKPIMDMNLWDSVFRNGEDIEFHKNSYAGWWYCCVPVKKIKDQHMPVPLFIRGDDVEFSVANNAEFLTLNGICIWHKGFANKFNANLELYMVHRNSLIIQAMSGICQDIDFIERIDGFFKSNLCRLAYNNCELLLDSIEEFAMGPDFMNTPQGEKIMKSHAAKNEKMQEANLVYDGPIDFDRVYWREENQLSDEQRLLYEATYNGQTLPDEVLKKGHTAVIAYDWFDDPAKQYLAEQILAVNPFDHTVCLRKRDKERFEELMDRYNRVMKFYRENKENIEAQYREAAKTLQSQGFWREYLKMK
ncbi:MAG: glycosyltransferase family 2 protein [Oscillospiraceae bacterium]|nr:glycosyltransferase family 2 protein [Oscillospiraceae bacterium]